MRETFEDKGIDIELKNDKIDFLALKKEFQMKKLEDTWKN